ncbi:MAG: hypothetical protein ACLGJB_25310 [Blastocatellia bacterium]
MTIERFDPEALTPDEAEREVAKKLSRELARRLVQGEALNMVLPVDESSTQYPLPATAAKSLVKILAEMARGNAVALVGLKSELTVGQPLSCWMFRCPAGQACWTIGRYSAMKWRISAASA